MICRQCEQEHESETHRVECIYCGALVPREPVPAEDDDESWERIKGLHNNGCEWADTRAHRRG
jgi:hypothetical protein